MVNPLGNGGSTRLGTGLKRRSHGADWGGGGFVNLAFNFLFLANEWPKKNEKQKEEDRNNGLLRRRRPATFRWNVSFLRLRVCLCLFVCVCVSLCFPPVSVLRMKWHAMRVSGPVTDLKPHLGPKFRRGNRTKTIALKKKSTQFVKIIF